MTNLISLKLVMRTAMLVVLAGLMVTSCGRSHSHDSDEFRWGMIAGK